MRINFNALFLLHHRDQIINHRRLSTIRSSSLPFLTLRPALPCPALLLSLIDKTSSRNTLDALTSSHQQRYKRCNTDPSNPPQYPHHGFRRGSPIPQGRALRPCSAATLDAAKPRSARLQQQRGGPHGVAPSTTALGPGTRTRHYQQTVVDVDAELVGSAATAVQSAQQRSTPASARTVRPGFDRVGPGLSIEVCCTLHQLFTFYIAWTMGNVQNIGTSSGGYGSR